jgi:hypothetical protein
VLLHEAQLLLHHLLGQPFVAIDVDLDSEREPGLQADVDQAELGIEEVVIEDPLLSVSADELGPLGAGHEGEGRTGFLSAEDADESLGDSLVADEALRGYPGMFACNSRYLNGTAFFDISGLNILSIR